MNRKPIIRSICAIRSENKINIADLCIKAAEKIIEKDKLERKNISILILVTETPDILIPSTSFKVHKGLNLCEDCIVYDIRLGASGYITGIQMISQLLKGCVEFDGKIGLLLTGTETENYSVGTATVVENVYDNIYFCERFIKANKWNAIIRKLDEDSQLSKLTETNKELQKSYYNFLQNILQNDKLNEVKINYTAGHREKLIDINKKHLIDIGKVLYEDGILDRLSSSYLPTIICSNKKIIIEDNSNVTFLLNAYGAGVEMCMLLISINTSGIIECLKI